MIEEGCGLYFQPKALQSLRILRNFLRKVFQGDMAMEFGVFCFADDTHAPTADYFDESAMRDGAANLGHAFLRLVVKLPGYAL
jgi:hypothetical protein